MSNTYRNESACVITNVIVYMGNTVTADINSSTNVKITSVSHKHENGCAIVTVTTEGMASGIVNNHVFTGPNLTSVVKSKNI